MGRNVGTLILSLAAAGLFSVGFYVHTSLGGLSGLARENSVASMRNDQLKELIGEVLQEQLATSIASDNSSTAEVIGKMLESVKDEILLLKRTSTPKIDKLVDEDIPRLRQATESSLSKVLERMDNDRADRMKWERHIEEKFSTPAQSTGPIGALGHSASSGIQNRRVFVYELGNEFRNNGIGEICASRDCAFGGPSFVFEGMDLWRTKQFEWTEMLHYRLLHSPRRTLDVNEAEVFFVPAYRYVPWHVPCVEKDILFPELLRQNPRLRSQEAENVARRHIIVDARAGLEGSELCNFMWSEEKPQAWFTRWNLEVTDWALDWKALDATLGRPWTWYAFPYPTYFHGSASKSPASTRPRGYRKFLWSWFGSGRGRAQKLRDVLKKECARDTEMCLGLPEPHDTVYDPKTMVDSQFAVDGDLVERSVRSMLGSTFCAQPPGDTLSRKGIIDSIVMGCIPILFDAQQLILWRGHFTRKEFESFSIMVPEPVILGMGEPEITLWAKINAGILKARETSMLQRPDGELKLVWQLLSDTDKPPWAHMLKDKRYAKPRTLSSVLKAVSEDEVRSKQEALARMAHRVIVGLEDGEQDALHIMLEKVVSDAETV